MKRSTAIRHLVEIATEASEDYQRFRDTDFEWTLEEIWVGGDLVEVEEGVEPAVILMLGQEPAEVPWLAMNPTGEWIGERLRLHKRPVDWYYRPQAWPAWNARYTRVCRIWSRDAGADEEMIESLRLGGSGPSVEPDAGELKVQLSEERQVAATHLRRVVADVDERRWRRHSAGELLDELWRAAAGLVELEDALAAIEGTPG